MASKPPTIVDLEWAGRLEFAANLSQTAIVIDSTGHAGPSPVELLGAALAGCMSIDLAHILHRGRHELRSLRSKLTGQRAVDQPHRVTSVTLHFTIEGPVPHEAVTRAIQLSRDKYCSVWHSMRNDIELQVTFDLTP